MTTILAIGEVEDAPGSTATSRMIPVRAARSASTQSSKSFSCTAEFQSEGALAPHSLIEELRHDLQRLLRLRQLEVIPKGVWQRLEDDQLRIISRSQ